MIKAAHTRACNRYPTWSSVWAMGRVLFGGVMERFYFCRLLPVCEWAVFTYPKRSPSLRNKTLPAIPVFMCVGCVVGCHDDRPPRCQPTWDWLCASSDWCSAAPQACTAALKRHFDGVLLPILPSLNRSCCHLYFDLCIPWSIYACERGEGRRGGGGGVGGGRQRQLQCSLLYPRERLRYICLLKASAPDKHSAAAERCYKASSVVPKPTNPPSQPPSWVNRHCMHVLYAQTKKVFFQLRPASLKRVKRCCSPLWELQKPKARRKTHRVLLQLQNPPQTRAIRPEQGFCTQYARLSSAFACLGRGKPLEGSRRTGTEEQTNLLRKEDGLQRLLSHKERISRWDEDPVASPLFITAIKQIS